MFKIINQLKQLSAFVSQPAFPRLSCSPSTFELLLAINISFLNIHSCGLDIEDPTPPSPPVWVQKSLPEEWPERGIDAHESGGILLEWEPNYEENISAYLIYRAEYFDENDSLGEFELRYRLEIELNTPTEFVDTEIEMRTSYYYKLKSNDISDNSSTFSDSLRYILLPQIPFNRMSPNGYTDSLSPLRSLNWVYSSSIELEDYCITILAQNNDLIIRMIQSPSSYVGWRESWEIPSYISLQHNNIYKWRVDMNARYINSMETAGSESAWATFLYVGD